MTKPLLEVQNLQAGYNGRQVLRQVSLQAGKGELIGLIGPNGAGKSTLLKALRGLLPAKGTVKIQDKALPDYTPQELARVLAYLPQHSQVPFAFTVQEVVLMGRAPYLRRVEAPTRKSENRL